MNSSRDFFQIVIFSVIFAVVLLAGAFFIPWKQSQWGQLTLQSGSIVTVSGTAETAQKSQVASYNAGVTAISDNRETAVSDVNTKVANIIAAVKTFGIPAEDIKTANISVYQNQESYYEEGIQKQRPGQWSVSNSVDVRLRDVDRAGALADLLTQSGATNVYGPNFTLDDTKDIEVSLLDAAIADARAKAEKIAAASDRRLGKTISVVEGYSQTPPIYYALDGRGGGGGAPTEPGTGQVSKSVTVTFELK